MRPLCCWIACAAVGFVLGCRGGGPSAEADAGDAMALDLPDGEALGPGPTADGVADADGEFVRPGEAGDSSEATFPVKIDLRCVSDEDCFTVCGKGTCEEGGVCAVVPYKDICVVADGKEATCYKAWQSPKESACLFCNPAVRQDDVVPFVLEEGFDGTSLPSAPTIEDLSGSGVVWHMTKRRSFQGDGSFYVGDEKTGNYAVGKRVQTQAVFTVRIPESSLAAALRFFLYLDTEQTEGYDVFSVRVRAGEQEDTLFASDSIGGSTGGVFMPVDLSLAGYNGKEIKLVFSFDTVDQGINSFEGAYVDSLQVTTGCCAQPGHCDDGNRCTKDSCPGVAQACVHEPIEGCCLNDAECDDQEVCTKDVCDSDGTCGHQWTEGCCHQDDQCDDQDECTQDQCLTGEQHCVHLPLCCKQDGDCVPEDPCFVGTCVNGLCEYQDTCCHADSDCDDGDPCTSDLCESGECRHPYLDVPGCCVPVVFGASFDASNEGFEFSSPVGGVGWHWVTDQKSTSSPGALYYGNPDTKDFDNGEINTGEAVSPAIAVPPGHRLKLSFQLYMDTESSSNYDVVTVLWREGDGDFIVWRKPSGFKMQEFQEIELDVTGLSGRTGRLAFAFDTVDSSVNDGEGVYIDDIVLSSDCDSDLTCTEASECQDTVPSTQEACDSGACTYTLEQVECIDDWDCNDDNWCTDDYCKDGQCTHEDSPWCLL